MNKQGKYFQLVQTQLIDDQIENISEYEDCSKEEEFEDIITIDDKNEQKKKYNFLFFKLLALNKPEWFYILFGCLTSIINGGMEPVFALILSKIVSVSFKSR